MLHECDFQFLVELFSTDRIGTMEPQQSIYNNRDLIHYSSVRCKAKIFYVYWDSKPTTLIGLLITIVTYHCLQLNVCESRGIRSFSPPKYEIQAKPHAMLDCNGMRTSLISAIFNSFLWRNFCEPTLHYLLIYFFILCRLPSKLFARLLCQADDGSDVWFPTWRWTFSSTQEIVCWKQRSRPENYEEQRKVLR